MDLPLRILPESEYGVWDAFVGLSPQGSVFSQTEYLNALSVRFHVLAVGTPGQILGGIVISRGILGAPALPLFVKYGGVLLPKLKGSAVKRRSREYEIQRAIVAGLRRYTFFEYNFHPEYQNWLPFMWAGYRQTTRYTYRIRVAQEPSWRAASHTRVRRHLKHAEMYRVERIAAPWTDNAVHTAVMAPYRRVGAPPVVPAERFRDFLKGIVRSGMGSIFAIGNDATPVICAAVLAQDARCAYLLAHGCTQSADAHMQTCLIAYLIDHTLQSGRDFDFEGSVIPSIEHYYRSFGGELTPYSRIWRPGVLPKGRRLILRLAKRIIGYDR